MQKKTVSTKHFDRFVAASGGLTKAARLLETTTSFVYQIKTGRRTIPAKHAPRWAKVIGCEIHDLRPDMRT